MRWSALGTLALLTSVTTTAHAGIDRKETHDLVDGMHLDIKVYPTVDIAMKFPTRVLSAIPANSSKYTVDLDDKKLILIVDPGAVITSLHITLESGEDVAILVEPVPSPKQVILSHVFRYPAAKLQRVPVCAVESPEQASADPLDAMNERFEFDAATRAEFVRGDTHLVVETTPQIYEGTDLKLRFKIHNLGARAYPVSAVQVLDADSVAYDEVEVAMVGALPSKLGPQRIAEGALVIHNADVLGMGWQIRLLSGVEGVSAATFQPASLQATWPTEPLTQERGALQGRVAVTMRAIGGATNLDDGSGVGIGAGRTAWALVRGVGGYASFGRFRYASLGVGADVLTTRTITIDSEQAAVDASAWGGRIHVGGRLHTGRRVMSYVRLGLGVAFAKHGFEADENADSEFRLAGLLMFGGGVDWLVSRRFLLGASFSANGPIFGQDTGLAFESVVYAGFVYDISP